LSDHAKIAERFRKAALAYPEAYEENPWGHRVAKVKGKIFLFADGGKNGLSVSVKLPQSSSEALVFPFAAPTGYGLGKSGWITATFAAGADVPEPLILEWLDESYRAIAPKKLVKLLDEGAKTVEKAPKSAKKRKARKSTPTVLLVGDDRLRLARAARALEKAGHASLALEPGAEVLGRAHEHRPRAVVLDLGRRQPVVLELASQLAAEKIARLAIVLAGARDAAAVRAAKKAVPGATVLRGVPGDPASVKEIAAVMDR
jgi:predicted DNA-binding protein (MmcQ/YjbR family)/CheY-like chemotaxis protein